MENFPKESTYFYICTPQPSPEVSGATSLKDLYILIVENRHDEPKRNKRNTPGTDYKDISMVRGEANGK